MYAIANGGGVDDRLVQIDMRDGTVTDVGALGVNDMEGFSQFNGGTLYGATGANTGSSTTTNRLWSIDINTGTATLIAPFTSYSDYESVSCLTEDGNLITGTVFNDTANLGTFDVGEGGLAGVTVRLYIDENNDGLVDSGDTLLATRTTDANGQYQFNLGIQDNFVLAVDTTTIPSGGSLSTDNVEEADFNSYGNTDNNNDFGISSLPALGIVKTSNASGNIVAAGDFVTYTIQIQNLSGVQQTNVAVSDPLPSNTSYVAQSTVATPSSATTSQETYRDEFTNIAYNGTNGSIDWSGSLWIEERDDGGGSPAESNGNILVATSGSCAAGNCLSIRAKKKEDRIYRQADLSSCTAATVSYNYNNQLEKKDRVDFEVSGDGGSNYDRLRSYTKDNTGSGTENFTLTAAQTAANTRLRFWVNKDDKDKFLFIDNVEIACDSSVSTKDNIPGGTYADLNNGVPPNLVQSTDGFTLAANDILTVTFQVQVDDPLASAVTQISNTASVTTDLITTAINASVTDYIPHLDSYEGDNAGNSTYLTLDELFYRDTSATGNAETALYTGGQGYLPIPPMT